MITHSFYKFAGLVLLIGLSLTLIALQQVSYADSELNSGPQYQYLARTPTPTPRVVQVGKKVGKNVTITPFPPKGPVNPKGNENPPDMASCAMNLSSLGSTGEMGLSKQFDQFSIISNNPDPTYEFFEQPVQLWPCDQAAANQFQYFWKSPVSDYRINMQNLTEGFFDIPDYSAPGTYELQITSGAAALSKKFIVREYSGERIRLYGVNGENITDLSIDSDLNAGAGGVSQGGILTARYEGFPPKDWVDIGLYGGPSDASSLDLLDQWQITVNSDGTFTEYLRLPTDAEPGIYRLVACASSGCQYFENDIPAARTTFELVTTSPLPPPSPSSTTTLLPIATPAFVINDLARINASADLQALWLRGRAGNNRRTLDLLSPNSLVEIVGRPTYIGGESWYKVQLGKEKGWLKATALLPVEQIPSVPYWRFAWTSECDSTNPVALALLLPDETACDPGVETWDLAALSASLLEQKLLKPGEQLRMDDEGEIVIRREGNTVGSLSIGAKAMDTISRIDEKTNSQVAPTCQLHTDYTWDCH